MGTSAGTVSLHTTHPHHGFPGTSAGNPQEVQPWIIVNVWDVVWFIKYHGIRPYTAYHAHNVQARRAVDKKHKETLESFNFAEAWNERRKSFASQYSPMGSRLPSRRSSLEFQRSMHMRRGDIGYLAEGSDEESTPCNVGMSRRASSEQLYSAGSESSGFLTPGDSLQPRPRSRHDTPFSAEDLTLALRRSRLE